MYLPFLRSKQQELLALRNLAPRLGKCVAVLPIVEPVGPLSGLKRVVEAFDKTKARFVLIANPRVGVYQGSDRLYTADKRSKVAKEFRALTGHACVQVGIILDTQTKASVAERIARRFANSERVWIHRNQVAPSEQADLKTVFVGLPGLHVVEIDRLKPQYVQQIVPGKHVALHDPFKVRSNATYPPTEPFSRPPSAYIAKGYQGVSDFTIVGDRYSATGGPAHAVAIHIVRHNGNQGQLDVDHYLSNQRVGTGNIRAKVLEALGNLDAAAAAFHAHEATDAIAHLRDLHQRKHPTGLGALKQYGMRHHIELMLTELCS